MPKLTIREARLRRHRRVRKNISGTQDCPRLAVFRSNVQIYAQLIDDKSGVTLVSASSLDKDVKQIEDIGSKTSAAASVGKLLGQRAVEKGIKTAVFDRGGFLYHGRIAALADGAREAGLEF